MLPTAARRGTLHVHPAHCFESCPYYPAKLENRQPVSFSCVLVLQCYVDHLVYLEDNRLMLNKNTSTIMNFTQAMVVISDLREDMGEGLLETLQYMQDNLDDFSDEQVRAFRVVMNDFRKLLTPAS